VFRYVATHPLILSPPKDETRAMRAPQDEGEAVEKAGRVLKPEEYSRRIGFNASI